MEGRFLSRSCLIAALAFFAAPVSAGQATVLGDPQHRIIEVSAAKRDTLPGYPGCSLSVTNPSIRLRTSVRGDGIVDACGRILNAAGDVIPQPGAVSMNGVAGQATIDVMTTRWDLTHGPDAPISLLLSAETYQLSDATQWSSGAGSFYQHEASLDHVETLGTTIRYVLSPAASGLIFEQQDYDSGDHSAVGKLAPAGPLVLEAQLGSTTATLTGNAMIVANDPSLPGDPRFNYYSSIPGSIVPFEVEITLFEGAWTPTTFSDQFGYEVRGRVDFANPISTPPAVELTIGGTARIPDEASTRYWTKVRYESGVVRDVTGQTVWMIDPSAVASVDGGVVTVGQLNEPEFPLTLHATYSEGAANLLAQKVVRAYSNLAAEGPKRWPMFQSDAQHTGSKPVLLLPNRFSFRWQRDVGGTLALNPVAAGEGKVFVSLVQYFSEVPSLFALSALDGQTLWSKDFGRVFSVNPPSYAYGNVYVQVGNHTPGTYLYAIDGDSGEEVFKAPHDAQWERYFAPTIHDYKAYANGGYYGGMYGFDALSGDRLWYFSLAQTSEWTPAVADDLAFAFVGPEAAGLYGVDRLSGFSGVFIGDPNFNPSGAMNLSPVVGSQGDVLVIHGGRLISFDPTDNSIRWDLQRQFSGQPSVSNGRIYAVDNGTLVVLDELTHADLWAWQPPFGTLKGQLIVTNSHVLVSSDSNVYAISQLSHQAVWSYPVAGSIAIADDMLYVSAADGTLTAFAAPQDRIYDHGFEMP